MYKNFVSDKDSSLFPIQDKRTSIPALSSTDDEEYFDFENTDLDLSGVISMTDEAQTINKTKQISIIMEQILTLQKQVSELTTQVNKLMQETSVRNANRETPSKSYSDVLQKSIRHVSVSSNLQVFHSTVCQINKLSRREI